MIYDIPVLFGKIKFHAKFIDMFHRLIIPKLLIFCVNQSNNCFYLSINIYLKIPVQITYILSRPSGETHCIFLLSRPSFETYYFPSFKTIFKFNHKGTPCSMGTLSGCTQIHMFQDHYMKNGHSTVKSKNMTSKMKKPTNLKQNCS